MEFNIYDIYADASINLDNKLGCSGIAVVDRKKDTIVDTWYLIKREATNNMCEIIAIWMAVYKAIMLFGKEELPFQVNIFSDSQISLFGLREWITSWISKRHGNELFGSNGKVANQEWFLNAYQSIVYSNLKLKFWHQKGHVDTTNPNSLFLCDKAFRTSNPNTLHMIGLRPEIIAKYNNFVDETSRNIIIGLMSGQQVYSYNVSDVPIIPMTFNIDDNTIPVYESLIRGGLNYPINFNGGIK